MCEPDSLAYRIQRGTNFQTALSPALHGIYRTIARDRNSSARTADYPLKTLPKALPATRFQPRGRLISALPVRPISGTGRRASGCNTPPLTTDRSSAWLERCVWDAEVAGSNPVGPTRLSYRPFGSNVEGLSLFQDKFYVAHQAVQRCRAQ